MNDQRWRYPGARWWKCDLHTHTPASVDYGKGPEQAKLMNMPPEEWLLTFMRAEIDCVAVTDHNSGDWIDLLKVTYAKMSERAATGRAVAGFRPLTLFPGVEIAANGGVHVLGILDPSKTSTDVAQMLGAARFGGTRGASNITADSSPKDVVHAIVQAGGIPILAHVDEPSGAFRVLSGSTLGPLLDAQGLFAIEVYGRTAAKPDLYQQRRLRWAEVLGSDSHHPNGAPGQRYPGSHFTWVKMGAPSLDGLRLALLDGNDVSVIRSDEREPDFDPSVTPEHFIESVEIANGRFIGRKSSEKLEFAPWFNALVGGRGTGKSTVMHFVRLAYRREGELERLDDSEPVARTFARFNHAPGSRDDIGGLSCDKSTVADIVVTRDGERYRLRWRQDGAGPTVEEQDGDGWRPAPSQACDAERFPLQLFSQGQIAALSAEGGRALLGLIDRTAGTHQEKAAIQEAERCFLALRAESRVLAGKLAGRDALEIRLTDVGRKLDKCEQAHYAEVLKSYRLRVRQRQEIERHLSAATDAAARIVAAGRQVTLSDIEEGLFDENSAADGSAISLLSRLKDHVSQTAERVCADGRALAASVEELREALLLTQWNGQREKDEQAYGALVTALQPQGVADPSEYGGLVEERQRLEGKVAELDDLEGQRQKVLSQAEDALRSLTAARRALSERRAHFLREALADNHFVRIELEPYGREPSAIERSLRDVLDAKEHFDTDILSVDADGHMIGAVADLILGLPDDSREAQAAVEERVGKLKRQFIDTIDGTNTECFGGHFANYLVRQYKQRPEFLDRLLAWYPDDSLKVEYSPKGDGREFRPMGQASAGQRAAAMLAFLLAQGGEPIVLDQPEDDLDNRLIYDLVVKQIRSRKQRRQIIVVTHNPNIVVNGDAEMIHALDFRDGQCCVIERGSLQDRRIRDEICRVMEGGREAFERRWNRLGADGRR